MNYLFYIFFVSTSLLSNTHLNVKSTFANKFALATTLDSIEHSIWPFDLKSIGNTMQSYQSYSMSPYWHDGLDIRGNSGQKVFASTSGVVVNIENYYPGNKLYWEIAILDDSGFVWKYHHIDHNSIPKKVFELYKKRGRIQIAQHIGNIVHWPNSSHGEQYHHVHLLIVDAKQRYINPFILLPKLNDNTSPKIETIGIFNNQRKKLKKNQVSGPHGIYVEVFDTVLHDQFKLTPYLISYTLDNNKSVDTWEFDYLPSQTNDLDFLKDFYLEGTCGNYTCRKFYININFKPNFNKFNTAFFNLAKGKHQIIIEARDFAGNYERKEFEYEVY